MLLKFCKRRNYIDRKAAFAAVELVNIFLRNVGNKYSLFWEGLKKEAIFKKSYTYKITGGTVFPPAVTARNNKQGRSFIKYPHTN